MYTICVRTLKYTRNRFGKYCRADPWFEINNTDGRFGSVATVVAAVMYIYEYQS